MKLLRFFGSHRCILSSLILLTVLPYALPLTPANAQKKPATRAVRSTTSSSRAHSQSSKPKVTKGKAAPPKAAKPARAKAAKPKQPKPTAPKAVTSRPVAKKPPVAKPKAVKPATAKPQPAKQPVQKPAAAKQTPPKQAAPKPSAPKPATPKPPVAKPQATARPVAKPMAKPVAVPLPKPAAVVAAASTAPTPPPPPPTAQAYVNVEPGIQNSYGQTMVPINFLANGLGASVGPINDGNGNTLFWRATYYGATADFYPYQNGARFNDQQITLAAKPMNFGNTFYVPWDQVADFFRVKWRVVSPAGTQPQNQDDENAVIQADGPSAAKTVMLLQYPAAYIQSVRHSVSSDKVRVVMELSNATRIVAAQRGLDVQFYLAGARRQAVPSTNTIGDYMVSRAVTTSGNWQANLAVRLNYSAPVRWFTMGSPPRLVVDLQRIFEEQSSSNLEAGISLTKIRRGTGHGPVQMYVVRADPRQGWRARVAPAGYSTLQRHTPSRIAANNKALVGVNGGFFAYDGAAVGAVLTNSEWIRLPWKGRTAVGFMPDGTAKIGNLQTRAHVRFSSGLDLTIRDLNGWPDRNAITALTGRFRQFYQLKPGEIAVVVQDGRVISKPGSGGVTIPSNGFVLIASGGAIPWLDKISRDETAKLEIDPIGWPAITSALGGGPRLVNNGRVDVTDEREGFRSDVRIGLGPRTAFGIDKEGRYIIVVVDGRQKFHSTGFTLTELAYTMQKLGAVDAMNFDGGGSSAMVVKNRVVNRPSDGSQRSVANALLIMH
jgi:exopolysaccharide biosynthesis protein